MDDLTEYERTRLANIAANQSLLAELSIKDIQEEIEASSSTPKNTKEKPVQPRKRKAETVAPDPPRRQSRRLRSTARAPPVNETKAQRAKREAEEAKLEKEAEEEAARLEAEERRAKMPRHEDLELEVLAEELDEEDLASFKVLQKTLCAKKYERPIGSWENDLRDDKRLAQAKEDLVSELKKLTLVSRAKVCKERIYSAAYHPIETKDVILFGDKSGTLGIWDARATPDDHEDDEVQPSSEDGLTWTLQPHWPRSSKSSISSIKINPRNAHDVFTSSYDGTLRTTSFLTGISRELLTTDDYLPSSVDLSPNGHELWLSDSGGGIQHLDTREQSRPRRWQLTAKEKIGCVSVNPIAPHLLLTASNNRTLRMWDSRYLVKVNLTTDSTEDGADRLPEESTWEDVEEYLGTSGGPKCLWGEWKHRQSVSSAFWDVSGHRIVSTSYDDTIRVWDIRSHALKGDGPLKSFRPTTEIKHNCQTGAWVTILRARWSENPDAYPHFTIGNMGQSLDIIGLDGQVLAKLSDRNKISAVQAVTTSHPSIVARAVSGNASGRCVLWASADL